MNNQNKLIYLNVKDILVSKQNVRKFKDDGTKKKALMESIKKRGVIQNITAHLKDDKYYVVAGGRRVCACHALQKNKELPNDFKLATRVIDEKDSVAFSLSENIVREKMHFADEFLAFSDLLKKGNSIKSIAQEFNLTQKEVKQRLALSDVHIDIINEYKKGGINLETVMSFTLCDDKEKQKKFFLENEGRLTSWLVTNAFTKDSLRSDNKIVQCVGLDEYKKRGGVITSDLFSDYDFVSDVELLNKMMDEKTKKIESDLLNKGWKWVNFSLGINGFEFVSYSTISPCDSKVPQHLLEMLNDKEKEYQSLDDEYSNDDLDDDRENEIDGLIENLDNEIKDLEEEIEKHLFFNDEQKKMSGVEVRLAVDGSFIYDFGLQKRDDLICDSVSEENPAMNNVVKNDEDSISGALKGELNLFANQLTQLELIKNPNLASLIYQFEVCYSLLSGIDEWNINKMFSSAHTVKLNHSGILTESNSYQELNKCIDDIDKTWIKENIENSFKAFENLTPKKRDIIFGMAVSMLSKDCKLDKMELSLHRLLSKKTGFKRYDYWRPNENNYLNRIKRNVVEKMMASLVGKKWVESKSNLTKKQFAVASSDLFMMKDESLSKTAKDKLATWLPNELK